MVTLITGRKGEGKTKKLIELTSRALEISKGNVVVIEKGPKLTFDISHKARLIDVERYNIEGIDAFYGFVCGVCAGNYDATDIFIESALKVCGDDMDVFSEFVEKVNTLAEKTDINITISVSADDSDIPNNLNSICNKL